MALIKYSNPDDAGKKQYMGKTAVRGLLEARDKRIKDALELANRWGSKAAQFEGEKLYWKEECRKKNIWLGVLVGYNVLLTIIWGCSYLA